MTFQETLLQGAAWALVIAALLVPEVSTAQSNCGSPPESRSTMALVTGRIHRQKPPLRRSRFHLKQRRLLFRSPHQRLGSQPAEAILRLRERLPVLPTPESGSTVARRSLTAISSCCQR